MSFLQPGALLLLAVPLLGEAGEIGPFESSPEPQVVTVRITSGGYDPPAVTVRHGDVVRFIQMDGPAHNIAFHGAPANARLAPAYGAEASSLNVFRPVTPTARIGPFLIGSGRVYEIRVGDEMPEGVYEFGCSRHSDRRGLLIVEDFEDLR